MSSPLLFLSPERLLIIVVALFFGFGLWHIDRSETTDEHFWKYDRIPAYWDALDKRQWKKTYINDKPGVSIALVVSPGLFFSDPQKHRIRDEAVAESGAYTVYNSDQTSRVNWSLRLPLILFNTLILIFLFFAIRAATGSPWMALTTVTLTGLSPVLLGISRVINPDTLLWSTTAAAFFGFMAFLQTKKRWFFWSTLLFAGLALLSKYTANLLFPLLLGFAVGRFFFHHDETLIDLRRSLSAFMTLWLGSVLLYALLLPAALIKPERWWKGTFGFLEFGGMLWVLIALVSSLFVLLRYRPSLLESCKHYFSVSLVSRVRWLLVIPLFFFFGVFLLGLGNQSIIPLNAILQTAKEGGDLAFPLLAQDPAPLAWVKKMLVQAYPLVFSLPPLVFLLVLIGWVRSLFKKNDSLFLLPSFLLSFFALIYFAGALGADVLTNARYSVMLFPFFAFLAALGLREILLWLDESRRALFAPIATLVLIVLSSWTLYLAHPFPLNYTSPLLNKHFALHDGWGYGQYEAAQYLNALPDADRLLVWSDRNGLCQFLDGPRCLSRYKIDVEKNSVDYFVLSKRGQERNYIARDKVSGQPLFEYTSAIPRSVWRLNILDRPDNFIVIVPAR